MSGLRFHARLKRTTIYRLMQYKIFTIPISDNGSAIDEMNAFLRSHKAIETEKHFIHNEQGASWCFCVLYIEKPSSAEKTAFSAGKTDYRLLLSEADFAIFAQLRTVRKAIAEQEAIPAYAVFTDAELADIAKQKNPTVASLLAIKGIGAKKVEKYGERILAKVGEVATSPTL